MYTSIVVPQDGSEFGKRALPVALALARRHAAAVHLVHVHEPVVFPGNAPGFDTRLDNELRGQMLTELAAVAAQLTVETSLTVDAAFLDGPVAPTLLAYLAEHRPDLVVMATHGRGGLSRAWMGSVADGLVRHAEVPVLLVRPDAAPLVDLVEPLFRHVLVPLDGSAMAEEALDHVASLGTPGATRYTLLTVVVPLQFMPPLEYPYPGYYVALPDGAEAQQRRATALERLDRSAEALRATGAPVETVVVVDYQAAQAILTVADEQHADVIALSTHGRGPVSRVLLGSVADKVMRGATVPVLMYRPAHTHAALSAHEDTSDMAPLVAGAAMLP